MSNVCIACFQNKTARRLIRDTGVRGDCDFCDAKNRKVIEAYKLRDLFSEVVGLYRPYELPPGREDVEGESLAQCLLEWDIFSESCDIQTQDDILDEIMGFDAREGDTCASDAWEGYGHHWSSIPSDRRFGWFASYLKRSRRFIIEEDPSGERVRPETWVPDLLTKAAAVFTMRKNARLYRGRMGFDNSRRGRRPLPPQQMTAPPPRLARAGRANPEGISVLYCALEAETAIIETGRFPGAAVTLRELRCRKPIRLADLRSRWFTIEPLATPRLADEVEKATLLGSLGRALGEPIHPEDSAIEYVPTQYLSEVIRSAGYDGICFGSALRPKGTNVVIFDPTSVRVTRRGWIFELGRADYTIHPIPKIS